MRRLDADDAYLDDQVLSFAADGEVLTRESFVSTTDFASTPLRLEDGWVTVGRHPTERRVRFEFFDSTFAPTAIIDDPLTVPGEDRWSAGSLRITPTGFAFVVFLGEDENGVNGFELRSYDHAGSLLGSMPIDPEPASGCCTTAALEVATDGTIYVLVRAPLTGSNTEDGARLHRFVF